MLLFSQVSVCWSGVVWAQYGGSEYDSPLPPRPQIPGAVPAGGAGGRRSGGPRRVVAPGGQQEARPLRRPQLIAVARPPRIQQALAPAQPPRPLREEAPATALPPRPVVEDLEELLHFDDIAATTLQPSPQPLPVQEAQPTFRPAEPVQVNRRPIPTEITQPVVIQRSRPVEQQLRTARPQQVEQQTIRFRPAPRPALQEERARPQQVQRAQQPINRQQQVVRNEEYERPEVPKRQRKPVSQVLRKYREDNPDGSITWGFENDDGTFKEETIGVDCVTRGKYGYIDPDGVRREFTYSSGLPCDKDKDAQEQQGDQGYIDYSNNKYVLPNGDSVELTSMVKNKARKSGYKN
ncbi:hypothetical protein AAG570_009192 [Ranatra chinensis]|uniref:Uncharacterized protein n=1 Tax=Ranatra chinensis TaxID=642074 RepID=A0ABD0Z5W6_9HEMI